MENDSVIVRRIIVPRAILVIERAVRCGKTAPLADYTEALKGHYQEVTEEGCLLFPLLDYLLLAEKLPEQTSARHWYYDFSTDEHGVAYSEFEILRIKVALSLFALLSGEQKRNLLGDFVIQGARLRHAHLFAMMERGDIDCADYIHQAMSLDVDEYGERQGLLAALASKRFSMFRWYAKNMFLGGRGMSVDEVVRHIYQCHSRREEVRAAYDMAPVVPSEVDWKDLAAARVRELPWRECLEYLFKYWGGPLSLYSLAPYSSDQDRHTAALCRRLLAAGEVCYGAGGEALYHHAQIRGLTLTADALRVKEEFCA
ncbi:hypothetical protein EDC56_1879 [Sinobacterium caligoides]|uniref:Uncharacterized protein n=1 Tax=Sinobacterium caligoides TaxID=933926 RepID=A0A3N2DNQ0_9GAMM|nr:hypothetical protein [Sinobacterium caligoides]ROS01438.1 hypothetical protein EDC56_1879 [Sinobacterium caligoides]